MQVNLRAFINLLTNTGRKVLLIGRNEEQYRIFIATQFTPAGKAFGTVNHLVEGYEVENPSSYMGVEVSNISSVVEQKLDSLQKVRVNFSPDYSYEYYDSL